MVKVLPLPTQPNSLALNHCPSPSMGWGWAQAWLKAVKLPRWEEEGLRLQKLGL